MIPTDCCFGWSLDAHKWENWMWRTIGYSTAYPAVPLTSSNTSNTSSDQETLSGIVHLTKCSSPNTQTFVLQVSISLIGVIGSVWRHSAHRFDPTYYSKNCTLFRNEWISTDHGIRMKRSVVTVSFAIICCPELLLCLLFSMTCSTQITTYNKNWYSVVKLQCFFWFLEWK